MFQRRIPEWLRHAPAPSVRGFAVLAGVESAARGILVSVFPIAMYRTFGDSRTVSEIYFLIGIGSLVTVLLVPWLVLSAGAIATIPRIEIDTDIITFFQSDSPVRTDFEVVNRLLSGAVPIGYTST